MEALILAVETFSTKEIKLGLHPSEMNDEKRDLEIVAAIMYIITNDDFFTDYANILDITVSYSGHNIRYSHWFLMGKM